MPRGERRGLSEKEGGKANDRIGESKMERGDRERAKASKKGGEKRGGKRKGKRAWD